MEEGWKVLYSPRASEFPKLYIELSKAKLASLVALTTMAGYAMAPGTLQLVQVRRKSHVWSYYAHIYMYTYIHTYIHTHTPTKICIYIYICMYVYLYMRLHSRRHCQLR